jgi:KTSC domain
MILPTIVIRPEAVDVEPRVSVALTEDFDCRDIKRSSIVQRVCYEEKQKYLIVNIEGIYHQYCDVPVSTYVTFMGAFSMGHYFQNEIEDGSNNIRYKCRVLDQPSAANYRLAGSTN